MALRGEGQPVFPVPFTGSAASCWASFSTAFLFLSACQAGGESPGNCTGPELGCLRLSFSRAGEPDMLMGEDKGAWPAALLTTKVKGWLWGGGGVELWLRVSHVRQRWAL